MDAMTIFHEDQRVGNSSFYANGNSIIDQAEIVTDEDTLDIDTYENGSSYPKNVPEELDIREDPQTIYEWIRKLDRGGLIIDPEFQRNLVWTTEQKSQFIESILVNIPLPPLYVNQRGDGKYIVVDGLQRTSTMAGFIKGQFALSNLHLLQDLNGRTFNHLKPHEQARIEDRKLLIYVIKSSVPLSMVYDIFHRINTGGTQLTRQEIRNSFYTGKATYLLKELSEQDYFQQAINNGISPKRMKDREAILRYLAFRIRNYRTDYENDMDAFLSETMQQINQMGDDKIQAVKIDFERVMRRTYEFFGEQNFRLPTNARYGRINLALMEAVAYFFAQKSDEFLDNHKQNIRANYQHLLTMEEFLESVRLATGDKKRVIKRFELVQKILGDVEC